MDNLVDYDQDLLAPPWGSLGRDAVLGVVAAASKFLLNVLNRTSALNHSTYLDIVMNRPPGVGLLTISNHTSTYDDPGLPCALLPLSFFWTEHTHHKNRWTMCAQDICFTNHFFKQFFLNGKVLPVERGAGVEQHSVSVAARALGSGDWLHIFPEGRVTPDGQVGPFRQGIGKLVCEARAVHGSDPIILPFFHSGMSRVMPFKSSVPRVGQEVVVAVGQPLDLSHITCRCNQPGEDQPQVWRDLAVALRHAVMELQDKVPPNPNQVQDRPEVAEYERKYQERQRKAREQQQQQGLVGDGSGSSSGSGEQRLGGEPALMAAHDEQQQGHGEQQWQRQQEQLMAVIRRISAAHQLEHEWVVDLDLQEGQQQHQHQQGAKPQHSAAWRDQLQRRWAQGQHILHTWQHMQDRQVSYLLARSKAAAARAASSSSDGAAVSSSHISVSGASVSSSAISSGGSGSGSGNSSQRSSSEAGGGWPWSIGPWLPFLSSSDGADSS